ncbi:MAG: GIY-YIG nuclease family protein [Alphaproteobacteria bacterium]
MAARRKRKPHKPIIKNYGLMWERDRVFWGRSGVEGELRGSSTSRKGINFRDQIGVYVLYDEAMRPIYVGQAGRGNARLFNRLKQHARGRLRKRWSFFSWFGLLTIKKNGSLFAKDYSSKRVPSTLGDVLNEIEGVLIAAIEPRFNKQGSRFITTERFQQDDPPENIATVDDLAYEINGLRVTLGKRLDQAEKLLRRIEKKL